MRTVVMRRVGVPIVLIGLAACSEPSAPIPEEPFAPDVAAVGNCELASGISELGSKYFTAAHTPEMERLAAHIVRGCGTGDQRLIRVAAWEMLSLVEIAAAAGLALDDAAGSSLVNTLLACTVGACRSADLPGIDFLPALGGSGVFAVRRDDQQPAIAHGAAPFTDASGNANTALWGVEVTQPWSTVTSANPVLIYGGPGGTLAPQDIVLGNLQFTLDVFPDAGTFQDGTLHVGACFSQEIALPHVGGDEAMPTLRPRMQREGVLLSTHSPGFCPPPPSSASLFGAIANLLEPLAPSAIRDLFRSDLRIRVVGGTPLDFSEFAPVGANPLGTSVLLNGPPASVLVGQSLGPMRVLVTSGGATPMERILVTVRILRNLGEPAGAILNGTTSAFTSEVAGQEGIAVLDGISIDKPGGYTLCFGADEDGYDFPNTCAVVMVRPR